MLHKAPLSRRPSGFAREWLALLIPVALAAIYAAAVLSLGSSSTSVVEDGASLSPAFTEPVLAGHHVIEAVDETAVPEAEPVFDTSSAVADDHTLHAHDEPMADVAVEPSAPQSSIEIAAPLATPQAEAAGRIVLWRSETWDAVSAANIQAAVALLPASVQAQLGNPALGPVKVIVSWDGRTTSGYQPYGRAANFFSTNEATNEVVLYPQQSVFTVLHELGHAYNLRRLPAGNYAGVLLDPEMQSFMAMAGWEVTTQAQDVSRMIDHSQVSVRYTGPAIWESMSREDPLEDFANSFALFFLDPAGLADKSPERFAWFDALF